MQVKFIYRKKAIKFIKKNSHILSQEKVERLLILALQNILLNISTPVDVIPLKGLDNLWRCRVGKIRIIFSFDISGKLIVNLVENIDWRGSVY